jgi:hypothetical protein
MEFGWAKCMITALTATLLDTTPHRGLGSWTFVKSLYPEQFLVQWSRAASQYADICVMSGG